MSLLLDQHHHTPDKTRDSPSPLADVTRCRCWSFQIHIGYQYVSPHVHLYAGTTLNPRLNHSLPLSHLFLYLLLADNQNALFGASFVPLSIFIVLATSFSKSADHLTHCSTLQLDPDTISMLDPVRTISQSTDICTH